MNNEHDLYDLFFRYENGTLQTEELQHFQERLKNDDAFREALENYQLAGEIVLTDRLYQVRKQLNQLNYDQNDSSGSNTWKYIIAISGAIFLGGLGGYYLLHEDNTTTVTQTSHQEIVHQAQQHSTAPQASPSKAAVNRPSKEPVTEVQPEADAHEIRNEETPVQPPSTNPVAAQTPQQDSHATKQADNKPSATSTTNPCQGVTIKAEEILSDATCPRGSDGKITIKGINGGQAPYHCVVNKRSYADNNFSFEYLRAGEYEIQIIDRQKCMSTLYVTEVHEKNCETDFSIKPSAGIFWTPSLSHANAAILIQDKTGNILLNRKISGQEFTWDGTDQYGNLLANGLYFYKIIYDTGEKESGTITIIE